jgi:uncharacterized protein
MTDPLPLLALAAVAGTLGTLGGLGGAVLLVPFLVVTGTDPLVAAPIGLVMVGAASLAAAPAQLAHGLVHHRLGLTVEIPASAAALLGALWSVHAPDTALRGVLVVVVLGSAIAGLTRAEPHNQPRPEFIAEPPAEWPGTLSGTYLVPSGPVPYRARRLPFGLAAMVGAGAMSGLAGVSGGFVKTPVMREIMWIPVKVAAATSTFTVSITTATALLAFWGQGRIDAEASAAAGLGGLIGGVVGAWLQDRMEPTLLRRFLAAVLFGVAVMLVVGS